MAHCLDVLDCLREDYARLRACAVRLCADPCPTPVAVRAGLHELHRVFDTSSVAEEEVLLERALGLPGLRVAAMASLEENELIRQLLAHTRLSADNDQLCARARVLGSLVARHLAEIERGLLLSLEEELTNQEREEMGMRYREIKERKELAPVLQLPERTRELLAEESGRIGYIIAWLLGVPVWILLLVFLIRGH